MQMHDKAVLTPPAQGDVASTEVFIQVGTIARQLHDALAQLGLMPQLRQATEGLPDARSRLRYIADKTAAAAEKVLDSVDQAKAQHERILAQTRALAQHLTADPVRAVASGAVLNFVGDVEASTTTIDRHLTDIMLAQDFHDLTGQVVAKVVTLADQLESSLLKMLVQVVPPEQLHKVEQALSGPVIDAASLPGSVKNQGEVDDLLASLGF